MPVPAKSPTCNLQHAAWGGLNVSSACCVYTKKNKTTRPSVRQFNKKIPWKLISRKKNDYLNPDSTDTSLLYRVLCTGGDGRLSDDIYGGMNSTLDGHTVKTRNTQKRRGCLPIKPHDNIFNLFFQRYYAPLLRHGSVKVGWGRYTFIFWSDFIFFALGCWSYYSLSYFMMNTCFTSYFWYYKFVIQ